MLKKLLIVVGVLVALVAGVGLWAVNTSDARLAQTWPDVVGKELPVPFPLTEAEVEHLRQKLIESGKDHSGNDLVPTLAADGTETSPDPLDGADLSAIALERAIERGSHLYNVRLACKECHGADLGGKLVVDAQPVWTWYGPNISRAGVTKDYTKADWDRIIRHGVKPDDTNATMPAIDYMALSDQEISDLIAYAQSMPSVDTVQPETTIGPIGRLLLATGKMPSPPNSSTTKPPSPRLRRPLPSTPPTASTLLSPVWDVTAWPSRVAPSPRDRPTGPRLPT